MTDPVDRAAIRRRARAIAISRGMTVGPDPDAPVAPVELPTQNVFALRGLLVTGRLTPEQEPVARRLLADHAAAQRNTDPNQTPGDAA